MNEKKMKHQSTLKSIDSYITNVIKESVKSALHKRSLLEQEATDEAADSAGDELEKLKKGDVTVDDVVEKLNSIRAGKSFKDEEISAALQKYFDDLENEEKIALLAFLKGISQIVTGEFEPTTAFEPADKPAKIEMKKKGGPSKRTLKPLVIKAPDKSPDEKKEKAKSSEDTSGPVPITPKKK